MSVVFTILGQTYEYDDNLTYLDIAKDFKDQVEGQIVMAKLNNTRENLNSEITRGGKLEFVTTADKDGKLAYRRGISMVLQAATHRIFNNRKLRIQHSIGNGYYCEYRKNHQYMSTSQEDIDALKAEMNKLIAADHKIVKESISTQDAIYLFESNGRHDKADLLRYRRSSMVSVYNLDGYRDYFCGTMPPATGMLGNYDLKLYQNGFMLLFPVKHTDVVDEFTPLDKFFQITDRSAKWGESIGVRTVGDLNNRIAKGEFSELILIQEAYMEKNIGDIARTIADDDRKKFVLIAGPSSSGKTTFSHRLSIQLSACGKNPHPIAMDDFYVNREDTPKDENGEYDYECLEAIDVELFNKCMTELLEGKDVILPIYNFKTGKREWRNKPIRLEDNDVLVIEGIHGLNERLSYLLPKENKFKIYISALTQLNIDTHNNVPTTDGRLLRRMVRDARTRNTTARETIARWPAVRAGEDKNIFPFQEEADVMFNSALVYELAVLKPYAEALLFAIGSDCEEYAEARRLLKFLDYFLPVPSDNIGNTSILREFIGGSFFNV